MTGQRILIAEDDPQLGDAVQRGLREEGFECRLAPTAALFLEFVERESPDGLIIDIGLPDADGRDLCHALRARGITAPVVFLTARDALPDRLSGFAAGGDDYLTKPFAFAELVARLRALLRRNAVPDAGDGRLRVDPLDHAAHCGGESVPLTPTEYRLLALLAARGGEVVRRAELVQAGWPHGAIVHDNTLDAYIARLRRKIRAMPGAPELATVHGVGYSLR
ncbi:MAG TPA: response regulator transcription factor [Gaiellales bacterium]|nr:response regulator transcription factor [Gaiellales bacterium]